jgi:hypothetical protein
MSNATEAVFVVPTRTVQSNRHEPVLLLEPHSSHDCVAEPEMLEPGSAATTRSCPDTVPCSMLGR